MSSFRNKENGVVISVADHKDDRYTTGWEPVDAAEAEPKRPVGRPRKTEN